MALTEADIEQFITELQANPQLRDRVRDVILAQDFLALPGIVERLGERIEALALQDEQLGRRMDQLGRRVDQLGERVDQLGQRVDQLGERVAQLGQRVDQLGRRMDDLTEIVKQLGLKMDRFEGRLGNVEGDVYETKYVVNLGSHVFKHLRRARRVFPSDVTPVFEARRAGKITDSEWDDMHDLDVLAVGIDATSTSESAETYLAIELSVVVDRSDVERATRRAEILRRAGIPVTAAVDGRAITTDAEQAAKELGVAVFVRKIQPAA